MTHAVPVRKRGISNMIARSPKNDCLGNATEAATAIAKDEDVLIATETAKSSCL